MRSHCLLSRAAAATFTPIFSGKATKQGRRKGAKPRAVNTRARERSPKAVELQKQLAEALQRQAASAVIAAHSTRETSARPMRS